MANIGQRASSTQRQEAVFAIVLIGIGLVGLATQLWQPTGDLGGWILLAIGVGFLVAFGVTRQYGYLVPGGVLTGLGAGILASQGLEWTTAEGEGAAVVLGLGFGFLAILALGTFAEGVRNHWWPIIPGGILTTVGGALLVGDEAVQMLDYWGIAVVAIGIFLLWRAWARGGRADSGT